MKHWHIGILLSFLLLLSTVPAVGGDVRSLGEKVFSATLVVEIRMTVKGKIPKSWPNKRYDPAGRAFPDAILSKALKSRKIVHAFTPGVAPGALFLPTAPYIFSSGSPCWWDAHRRGSLRVLLFFRKNPDGSFTQIAGVEHETGQFSDLNPDYDRLIAAVTEAVTWSDERMRAVPPESLWQKQRAALRAHDNPYLQMLAAQYLREHQGEEAVREAWGNEPEATERALAEGYMRKVCGG